MRSSRVMMLITWAGVGAMSALAAAGCDLDLKPYVDPVKDGGGLVPVDSGGVDARRDDDGALVLDAGTDARLDGGDAGPGVKRVFVTSTTTNGSFGGVAGADTRCQAAATGANMNGTFLAWVSVTGAPAPLHLTGDGPWFILENGKQPVRVFANKLAIALTGPEVEIEIDEKGNKIENPMGVWTGTASNGTAAGMNCANFASPIGNGLTGEADKMTAAWTQSTQQPCTQPLRLYCFEQ